MKEVFASLYELFLRMGFFDPDLGLYLYGYDCNTGMFTGPPLYSNFGLIMLLGSFVMAAVFYYVINHPRFNRWHHWSIILGANLIIQFAIPYFILTNHLDVGRICGDLVVTTSDISGFAWSSVILAFIVYVFASLLMRWWSRNSSCTPYPL